METPRVIPPETVPGGINNFQALSIISAMLDPANWKCPPESHQNLSSGVDRGDFADRRPKGCFGPVRAVTAGDCVAEWVPSRFAGVLKSL